MFQSCDHKHPHISPQPRICPSKRGWFKLAAATGWPNAPAATAAAMRVENWWQVTPQGVAGEGELKLGAIVGSETHWVMRLIQTVLAGVSPASNCHDTVIVSSLQRVR